MERMAAVDIGTSSTRLLVVEREGDMLVPIFQNTAFTRLGQGNEKQAVLQPEAMKRTSRAIGQALELAGEMGARPVALFGTSALREAANKEEFCQLVHRETGRRPEILSGEREAHLTYTGAVRALGLSGEALIVDVGGGSTEFVLGRGPEVLWATSVKIGAVRLLERFLHSDPPTERQWDQMMAYAGDILADTFQAVIRPEAQVVGVGGTATTAAALLLELKAYDADRVQGHVIQYAELAELVGSIRSMPSVVRSQLPALPPGRADIFPAGAAILCLTLNLVSCSELVVSDADLLMGMLYERQADL